MYGYNDNAELTFLVDKVNQADALLKEYVEKDFARQNSEALEEFLQEIDALKENLILYGRDWKQRPVDLLAHRYGEEAEVEALKSGGFARCMNWTRLTHLLAFASAYEKNRAGTEGSNLEIAKPLLTRLKNEVQKEDFSDRKRLNVFDREISFYERMARWQEDTLSGVEKVVIPEKLWSCLPDSIRTTVVGRDFFLFCAMVYRHLERSQEDAAKAMERKDFWVLPGGAGLGVYQKDCTPGVFLDHVRKALRLMEKPPVQLMSWNGTIMVHMDENLFQAFQRANQTSAPEGEVVDEHGNLILPDDGAYGSAEALLQYLGKDERIKKIRCGPFCADTKDDEAWTLWKELAANKTDPAWLEELTMPAASEPIPLSLLGNVQNWKKRTDQLLCGYLVWTQSAKEWTGTQETLKQALEKAVAADNAADSFQKYREKLKQNLLYPMKVSVSEDGQSYTLTLSEKKQLSPQSYDCLNRIYPKQGTVSLEGISKEKLNTLFLEIAALYQDISDSKNNRNERIGRMKDFFRRVLHWYFYKINCKQVQRIELMISAQGCEYQREGESQSTNLEPFRCKGDVTSFQCFLDGSKRRDNKLSKGEKNGRYTFEIGKKYKTDDFSEAETDLLNKLFPGGLVETDADLETLQALLEKYWDVALPAEINSKALLKERAKPTDRLSALACLYVLFRLYLDSKETLSFTENVTMDRYGRAIADHDKFRSFLEAVRNRCREKSGEKYLLTVEENVGSVTVSFQDQKKLDKTTDPVIG